MNKNKYPGVCMIYEAIDSNHNCYPLAVALVDAENDENYIWFLKNISSNI